jgi:selenide, water dikinase
MGPGDLETALASLQIPFNPNVLTGLVGSEDAGIYKISEDLALVQTVDFFTPIVDDPFLYGKVAAANSLSDVYAMGGKPITALNIVCFPSKKLGLDVLRRILEGGLEILNEANVALIGGHSVEDDEPKYGLSVTGIINPHRIMTNAALKPGDCLIITKPLGTGIIATAGKAGTAPEEVLDAMVKSMCTLNKVASEVAQQYNVRAATDITGFGLLGHLVEMARNAKVLIEIDASSVPLLPGAVNAAKSGFIPGGAYANKRFFSNWIEINNAVRTEISDLLFDPQTSGGLVLGLNSSDAQNVMTALKTANIESSIMGKVIGANAQGLVKVI